MFYIQIIFKFQHLINQWFEKIFHRMEEQEFYIVFFCTFFPFLFGGYAVLCYLYTQIGNFLQ